MEWMWGRMDGLECVSNLVWQLSMKLCQRLSESEGKGNMDGPRSAASYSAAQPQHVMENPAAVRVRERRGARLPPLRDKADI